ncbi:secreted phosphoprotein 24 isoform X2 [Anarrhichthys ocellatus]|uniref:secreted phosphoprotein 24 isoform X2 n=1 Tax=Anarrhichthys ocellatus TaxID=433405 RepID=UPI0012EE966A|nr:secreted phosphoprotein 24 isoform X2 [Anarrhichthys ocellatus]
MRSYALLLALLQSLGCSGIPLYNSELEALADRGLGAALAEVNSVYAANHLYRVTRGSVTRIIPMGLNTTDLLMVFGIKETECVKASRNNPQTCAFRPGFFVPSLSCSSRVRMSATSTQVVSLRCGDSSSSSSSSEEMISRGRHQFNMPFVNRAVPAPPAPPQPGRFLQGQRAEPWPRGDTFTNYLV